jgi:hypothetical protein
VRTNAKTFARLHVRKLGDDVQLVVVVQNEAVAEVSGTAMGLKL